MTDVPSDVIFCEVCRLPHRRGAAVWLGSTGLLLLMAPLSWTVFTVIRYRAVAAGLAAKDRASSP